MLFDIGYPDKIMPILAVPEKPVPNGTGWGKNKGGKVGLGRARDLYKELGSISTVREEMENKGVWGCWGGWELKNKIKRENIYKKRDKSIFV